MHAAMRDCEESLFLFDFDSEIIGLDYKWRNQLRHSIKWHASQSFEYLYNINYIYDHHAYYDESKYRVFRHSMNYHFTT